MKIRSFKAVKAGKRQTGSTIPQITLEKQFNKFRINEAAAKLIGMDSFDVEEGEELRVGLITNLDATNILEKFAFVNAKSGLSESGAKISGRGYFNFSGAWGSLVNGDVNVNSMGKEDMKKAGLLVETDKGEWVLPEAIVYEVAVEYYEEIPYLYIVNADGEADEDVADNEAYEDHADATE